MTRPNLNAVACIPPSLDGAIGSSGFHVLRTRWMEPSFLHHLVQTTQFIEAMCGVVQGALYPAVRPADIAKFQFRLPPCSEQTRIVAKLEELLSDLDAGVAELKAAQKKLAQYRQSLLKAAVEGALTAEWRAVWKHPPLPNPSPARGEGRESGSFSEEGFESDALPSPLAGEGLGERGLDVFAQGLKYARELRKQQTPHEHTLWQQLRAKRFSGYKFRRQQPLGRFIVDFVCFSQRLIVELDGSQHAEAAEYDAQRDAWLKQSGYRVLRFWNNDWAMQREAVLETIWDALQAAPPLPNPSPARGEGKYEINIPPFPNLIKYI
jgi:very-short-patch-repair endonuclease